MRNCPACKNTGVIQLQNGGFPSPSAGRYVELEGDATFGNYVCPVCQPVFYEYDLEQLNAGEKVPKQYLKDEGYLSSLVRRMGSRLGALASKHCVETKTRVDRYAPHELSEVAARMFVVKRDAKGWKNWSNR